MPSSRVAEVLYDSETVLRLVDRELEELCDDSHTSGSHLPVLLATVQSANLQIEQVLRTLRDSREALQDVTLREIHNSMAKLAEVISATEQAATRIMDGVDRAHGLIDQLDELNSTNASGDADVKSAATRTCLREELFAIVGALQFQDITSQQLGHVTKMLADVKRRLHVTAAVLEGGFASATTIDPAPALSFAESASTRNSVERQAAADVLWGRATRKPAY